MQLRTFIATGLLGLGFVLGNAQAEGIETAAFNGSGPVDKTVQDVGVRGVPFELVELDGNLIEAVGGEDYIFQDSTGKIIVHVPEELMVGQVISQNTPVKVQGEVHQDVVCGILAGVVIGSSPIVTCIFSRCFTGSQVRVFWQRC